MLKRLPGHFLSRIQTNDNLGTQNLGQGLKNGYWSNGWISSDHQSADAGNTASALG